MKRIAIITFMLYAAFFVNGQTNCTQRIKLDSCQDTIIHKEDYKKLFNSYISLQQNIESLSDYNTNLQIRLDKLRVDEFLNIQDTSIFGSNFLYIDTNSIPARSRDFYRLIHIIHDLDTVLNQKSVGSYSEMLKMAKENSDKASDIIDVIITTVDEKVFLWLSESQVAYYRRLINQYNELIETIK